MLRSLAPLLATLGLGACTVLGIRSGTEQPAYALVERLEPGGIEIRRYGPQLAAETRVAGGDTREARGEAFRILAAYIFGGNRQRREIAMTAPVAVDGGAPEGLAMRFFMPAGHSRASLPEPADPRVGNVELPAATLAVLRFSGSTSAAAVEARAAQLLAALARSPWRPRAAPVALFYDPPWTVPFLRRNEVAVPVERAP